MRNAERMHALGAGVGAGVNVRTSAATHERRQTGPACSANTTI